jgi:hypothetical protein
MINKKALTLSFLILLAGVIVLYMNPESTSGRNFLFLSVGCSVAFFLYGIGIGRYGKNKSNRKTEDHSDRY